ncbi:MAG: efflux RND transporter periplasmic adaptor subunit [Candidatus Pacebacteria bacterium]|nr:efflux RND transporter periplasmic adaptor subunit [Candidatus Paceibacterota bacterium]
MKKLLKNKKILFSAIGVILIIVLSVYFFTKDQKEEYNFSLAERTDLVQEISATGRIKAVDDIDLAFEKSGRINNIYIEVGDKVYKGQILAELEKAEIFAELSQARAGVASAEAKLIQLEALLEKEKNTLETLQIGTREEEILIYESKVENAEVVYEASIQNLIDKIGDSYTKSDDAIRNKIDPLFSSPRGTSPQIIFAVNDSQLENNIEWARFLIEQKLNFWSTSLQNINENLPEEKLDESKDNLNQIKLFLEDMALAINGLSVNSEFSQTIIDSYKTDIYTARTNINTAITNLSTAIEKLNTANTSLLISQNELALKKSGSTFEEISSQKAIIEQAEANIISQKAEIDLKESAVQASLAKLSKNTLRSPINGIITNQKTQVGVITSPGEIIISVISENDLEIETNIVEADIAYLKIGNKAKLSLDAYGEDVIFDAVVIKIDPAANLIEGVANYKTTLGFTETYEKIKAGMTADLDIITMELKNVIAIPYRAIIFKSGTEKLVRVLKDNNQIDEVSVKIGIVGNGSLVEIISGINEGDKVVTSIKK